MALRTIVITAAITAAAMIGTLGSASACCKAKSERTKPQVNVGTVGQINRNKTSQHITGFGGVIQNWKQPAPSVQQQELMIFVMPYVVSPTK